MATENPNPKPRPSLVDKTVFYRFFGKIEQGVVWYDNGVNAVRIRPLGCKGTLKEYGPWIDYKDLLFL
jgi:hypothetical protein